MLIIIVSIFDVAQNRIEISIYVHRSLHVPSGRILRV
jgi:hypothetical protein